MGMHPNKWVQTQMAQSETPENGGTRESFTNTRAISPVIGVVLLVGLTVALSAITGTLVFGLAADVSQTTPTVDVAFTETEGGAISVTHAGGDTLDSGTVEIVFQNQTGSTARETWQAPVEAGDSPESSPFDVKAGTEMHVVWTAADGEQSYTLGTYRVPA